MRIVFAGTPEFAVPSLRALVGAGHEVAGVITRDDAPLGRKRILTPSPVAQVADELGVPVHKANRLGDEASEWVRALDAELGVIVAYGGLVREPLLSMPALGWVNLHFSELPRWRGAAPVQRALMAGEQTLGVTVFRLTEALDDGAVLTRDEQHFAEATSASHALVQLAEFGTTALLRAIDILGVDAAAGEAQQGDATYAHKLSRADGKLDLSQGVTSVIAQWAGTTSEPGAYAMLGEQALKLVELRRVEGDGDPGGVGAVRFHGGQAVLTLSDGKVELTRVQPSGKSEMAGADWLRGRAGVAQLS